MKQQLLVLISFFLLQQQLSAQCNPDFSSSSTDLTVNVTSTQSGANLYHRWSFGEGAYYYVASGTNPSATHTYNMVGTYIISHIIKDTVTNCTDTLFRTATINGNCNAAFSYTINSDHVNFTAGTSSPNKYHGWIFGDGSSYWSGTSPATEHIYNPGTYMATHIIQDSLTHCTDSVSHVFTVNYVPQCNASFIANLTGHFAWGDQYTLAPNYDYNGTTYTAKYTLDGQPVNMLYVNLYLGTHQICLNFQTTAGCTSTYCKTIVVEPRTPCNLTTTITATPDVSNKKRVHFAPQPLLATATYYWEFGDGTYSTQTQPVHDYLYTGNYTVHVAVSDTTSNCVDSAFRPITIAADSVHTDSCSVFFYSLNSGDSSRLFMSSVSHQAISYLWTVDSIPFSTAQNPLYTFPGAGSYHVCVMIVTAGGCHASHCETITIIDSSGRNSQRISAYPNPVNNGNVKLNLHFDRSTTVLYKVYNSFGMPVFSKQEQVMPGNKVVSLPVQQLPKGQYFIEIMYDGQKKKSVFLKL